jgi:hypothetical protein
MAVDDADRAEDRMEVELEALVWAARGVRPEYGVTCDDCGEPLPGYRQPYGRCVPCQVRRESLVRRGLVGV